MAATLSRVVLDRTGDLAMFVHPDDDGQLSDPAFAPANSIQVDILKAEFHNALTHRDLFALLQQKIAVNHPTIANVIAARVAVFDAITQADTDWQALVDLVVSFGANPTAGQLIQIVAARNTALNSRQAIQAARQNLADIIAALP